MTDVASYLLESLKMGAVVQELSLIPQNGEKTVKASMPQASPQRMCHLHPENGLPERGSYAGVVVDLWALQPGVDPAGK